MPAGTAEVEQRKLPEVVFAPCQLLVYTPQMTTPTEGEGVKEYLYKVLVVGDIGVGKTSIIKRYVHNMFSMHYKATIGVDFALKVINWDAKTVVRLQLWDIAGQERFGNMTRVYYKEAVGALVVFDVTRPSTFDAVAKWKNDIDSKVLLPAAPGSQEADRAIPVVLLANKADLAREQQQQQPPAPGQPGTAASSEQLDKYSKEHGFVGWFETSAKENLNIDRAARLLVEHIMANDASRRAAAAPADSTVLRGDALGAGAAQSQSGCPC